MIFFLIMAGQGIIDAFTIYLKQIRILTETKKSHLNLYKMAFK